jgi:hypothetical protein
VFHMRPMGDASPLHLPARGSTAPYICPPEGRQPPTSARPRVDSMGHLFVQRQVPAARLRRGSASGSTITIDLRFCSATDQAVTIATLTQDNAAITKPKPTKKEALVWMPRT